MTWEEAVKTMGKWFYDNIHSYWGGGGARGEISSNNPLFVSQGSPRATFKCPILGADGKVQNDCTAFVGACCRLFKPNVFPNLYGPSSAHMADPNSSSVEKLKAAGFQVIPWSKEAMQPGDIIAVYGGGHHHAEIWAGNGKAYAWGSVHDGRSYPGLKARSMPGGWSSAPYNWIYRMPGGWTGQVPDAGIGVDGAAATMGASGAVTGGGLATSWDGDFDTAAASADASRGKKLVANGSAQANILSALGIGGNKKLDSSIMKTPPRIWQYFKPDIVLPSISIPVDAFKDSAFSNYIDAETAEELNELEASTADSSTSGAKPTSSPKEATGPKASKAEANANTPEAKTSETLKNEDYKRGTGAQAKETHNKWSTDTKQNGVEDSNNSTGKNYANEQNLQKDLGRSFPILYINDHMFSEDEIEYFKIDCNGFIPTVELHVNSASKNIIKENLPKEGDTLGVFIQYTDTLIRPLRCDFVINEAMTKSVSQEHYNDVFSMVIFGELKIPDLHNSAISFSYQGSSRNALIDIAKKLKLGYCFNDPEDTVDAQSWYCTPEQSSEPVQYISDLATHLYKDASSFFDAWIDPRYNLTVINIRQMLGTTADCDEGIDLTKFVSVINNDYFDGEKKKEKSETVTPKIFNNFLGDQQGDTYYVYDYRLVNQASEISHKMGLLVNSNFGINSPGLSSSLTMSIKPMLALNKEKVANFKSSPKTLVSGAADTSTAKMSEASKKDSATETSSTTTTTKSGAKIDSAPKGKGKPESSKSNKGKSGSNESSTAPKGEEPKDASNAAASAKKAEKGNENTAKYIVLTGPGINKNQNDNPPENGAYTNAQQKVTATTSQNVQTDAEAAAIVAAQTATATGTTSKKKGKTGGKSAEQLKKEEIETELKRLKKLGVQTNYIDSRTSLLYGKEEAAKLSATKKSLEAKWAFIKKGGKVKDMADASVPKMESYAPYAAKDYARIITAEKERDPAHKN